LIGSEKLPKTFTPFKDRAKGDRFDVLHYRQFLLVKPKDVYNFIKPSVTIQNQTDSFRITHRRLLREKELRKNGRLT